MELKIKLTNGQVPTLCHPTDAGYDLYVPEDTYVHGKEKNNGRQVIPLGFSLELPKGYAASIRPRSGFSSKGILGKKLHSDEQLQYFDADSLSGLCDSGYRGIYGAIVQNHETEGFWIPKGTRIAQMVIEKVETDNTFTIVDSLSESDRGEGGYGSSN